MSSNNASINTNMVHQTDDKIIVKVVVENLDQVTKEMKESVQELYRKLYIKSTKNLDNVPGLIERIFNPKRKFVYLFAMSSEGQVEGFSRISDEPDVNAFVVTVLLVDVDAPEDQTRHISIALFDKGEEVGARLIQEDPTAQKRHPKRLWRVVRDLTPAMIEHLKSSGYSYKFHDRLEMSIDLTQVDTHVTELEDKSLTIKPLNIHEDDLVKVFDVLKIAFGSPAPSFEAWKTCYVEHPRFAPEFSFVAWNQDNQVAGVCLIERIIEGEGGRMAAVDEVYAKTEELKAENKEPVDKYSLAFPEDYEQRKETILNKATEGYVCGIATDPQFRGKGIGYTLLSRCIHSAAQSSGLKLITLDTDRSNESAVYVYKKVGMKEDKTSNSQTVVSKAFN